jgi:hypothetical protein
MGRASTKTCSNFTVKNVPPSRGIQIKLLGKIEKNSAEKFA